MARSPEIQQYTIFSLTMSESAIIIGPSTTTKRECNPCVSRLRLLFSFLCVCVCVCLRLRESLHTLLHHLIKSSLLFTNHLLAQLTAGSSHTHSPASPVCVLYRLLNIRHYRDTRFCSGSTLC